MAARRRGRQAFGRLATALVALVALGACGNPAGSPSAPPDSLEPDASGPPTASASPSTELPTDPASPSGSGSGASPATPAASNTPAGPEVPGSSTSAATPFSCTGQTPPPIKPVRSQRVSPQNRRTTEVVTVVSDGRTVTPGAREQTDFTTPSLTAPDGVAVTDPAILQSAAVLVGTAAKTTVLLARPEPPDTGVDPSRPPFNAAGTYVLYHASTVLVAEVVVQCAGQEQVWSFTAEGNPTAGQVNCAVEPARSNAIARAVHQANC